MDSLAATLKRNFGISTGATLELGGSQQWQPASLADTLKLEFGTGDGQANEVFADKRTLAATVGESLNLFDGALPNTDGAATSLTSARLIVVQNLRIDGSIFFGSGAATADEFNGPLVAAAGTVEIPALQMQPFYKPTGWVVDATHKLFHVRNSAGASADYVIYVAGLT